MDEKLYAELIEVANRANADLGYREMAAGVVQAYAIIKAQELKNQGKEVLHG